MRVLDIREQTAFIADKSSSSNQRLKNYADYISLFIGLNVKNKSSMNCLVRLLTLLAFFGPWFCQAYTYVVTLHKKTRKGNKKRMSFYCCKMISS